MTLEYSLSETDYLQYQLFIASKSESIKKQRLRSWIIAPIFFFSLSYLFSLTGNTDFVYYFMGFGILSIIFFPFYQKHYYKKHYKKFIAENYKNRIGEIVKINFTEINIECSDKTGESKLNLTEIEEIFETNEYFFLKMKTGATLIIPKLKIENKEKLRIFLNTIAFKLKVNFTTELNWEWK